MSNEGRVHPWDEETAFRTLFDSSPLPSWIIDRRNLRFLEVNQAAVEHYGYSKATFLSAGISLVRPSATIATIYADYQSMAEGEVRKIDRKHRRADGTVLDVSVTAHAVDYAGVPAILTQIVDLTEERSLREESDKAKIRLERILDASLDAVVTIDAVGIVEEWSASCERIFGYMRTDAVGKELASLILPERYRQAHRDGLAQYVVTGQARILGKVLRVEALRASGEEFPALLKVSRTDAQWRPLFTAFVRDLSEDLAV